MDYPQLSIMYPCCGLNNSLQNIQIMSVPTAWRIFSLSLASLTSMHLLVLNNLHDDFRPCVGIWSMNSSGPVWISKEVSGALSFVLSRELLWGNFGREMSEKWDWEINHNIVLRLGSRFLIIHVLGVRRGYVYAG